MNKVAVLICIMMVGFTSYAQKYISDKGKVTFFSHATLEDIAAFNDKSSSIFNVATGEIVFSLPMKEFEFDKSLMKDHFNEKYAESDKYPKASFQGTVTGFQVAASGIQSVKAAGKLTIHGVTKDVEIPGTIESSGGKLALKSKFIIKLADYNIQIPELLWQKIAEQVEVTLDYSYKVL